MEKWSILYSNVRGLKGKQSSIQEILGEYQPQIFLMTETLLTTNTGIFFKGYTFFGKARTLTSGGGVGMLVRNDARKHVSTLATDRNIEILWMSISRTKMPPLLIAVYYGKQESRVSKDQIETEFRLLSEEICEMSTNGEVLIAMDGNAKLGLLGEDLSRNGKILKQVITENGLVLINSSDKCRGKITRCNTKNISENSAIDFVITSPTVATWIKQMEIDEEGIMKVKGKNPTDHNTITIELHIPKIHHQQKQKQTIWNLRASETKWDNFAYELIKRSDAATEIMLKPEVDFQRRYDRWFKELEKAAWASIGKTTLKCARLENFSDTVEHL